MGNSVSRKSRYVVDDRYTRPQGLYGPSEVDLKLLRRQILQAKLAPCFEGSDEGSTFLEECPICFLHYPSLNRSKCCQQSICTECFLQVKAPIGAPPAVCPFCKAGPYSVEYRGRKTQEEKGKEQEDEQKVIEARIRMMEEEKRAYEERKQKQAASGPANGQLSQANPSATSPSSFSSSSPPLPPSSPSPLPQPALASPSSNLASSTSTASWHIWNHTMPAASSGMFHDLQGRVSIGSSLGGAGVSPLSVRSDSDISWPRASSSAATAAAVARRQQRWDVPYSEASSALNPGATLGGAAASFSQSTSPQYAAPASHGRSGGRVGSGVVLGSVAHGHGITSGAHLTGGEAAGGALSRGGFEIEQRMSSRLVGSGRSPGVPGGLMAEGEPGTTDSPLRDGWESEFEELMVLEAILLSLQDQEAAQQHSASPRTHTASVNLNQIESPSFASSNQPETSSQATASFPSPSPPLHSLASSQGPRLGAGILSSSSEVRMPSIEERVAEKANYDSSASSTASAATRGEGSGGSRREVDSDATSSTAAPASAAAAAQGAGQSPSGVSDHRGMMEDGGRAAHDVAAEASVPDSFDRQIELAIALSLAEAAEREQLDRLDRA